MWREGVGMNRREMLASALSAFDATIEAVESDPPPLFLKVKTDVVLMQFQCEAIRDAVRAAIGESCPPVLVVWPGVDIEAVREPME